MPRVLTHRLVLLTVLVGSGLLSMMISAGCGSVSVSDRPTQPTPIRPRWSDELLREHLRFLSGTEGATGTAGYATAGAYVAARLEEFEVQPVLDDEFRVEVATVADTGAINLLGFVAGKHPERARELVIVAADLDNVGLVTGVPPLTADQLGVGVATLLELARHYALFGQFGSVPERTVLFAVFSGGQQGHAGLRNYLQVPAWPLDKTHAIIYLSLDAGEEPTVRDLLAPSPVPLYPINVRADTLQTTVRSQRKEDDPRLSALIAEGVARARIMASVANDVILREVVTPAPFRPVLEDMLQIPPSNDRF